MSEMTTEQMKQLHDDHVAADNAKRLAKDMDLYTAHPDTVEPLPFHAMPSYPYPDGVHFPDDPLHESYRREWNTRRHGAVAP